MSQAVTWLLPIKNGMPYLTETLASIEAQTYRNWQVLAWDNGSSDGTVEELKRWIPSRLPGRVVTGRPLKLGPALAVMIEETSTDWCARIDADDVNMPDRLEKQMAYVQAHPEVVLLGTQVNSIDANGANNGLHGWAPVKHDDIVHALLIHNPIIHPSVVLRRDAVLQAGNYQHHQDVEDYDLWLRLAAEGRMANLPEVLLHYRQHAGSVTQQALKRNTVFPLLHERLCSRAEEVTGCTGEEMSSLISGQRRYAWPLLNRIARHLQKKHGGTVEERLRIHSFLHAARHYTSPYDIRTRLHLARMEQSTRALFREVFWIMRGGMQQALGKTFHKR